MAAKQPTIAITMGDPSGVGPEIIVKSLNDKHIYETSHPFVVGDAKILKRALEVTNVELKVNSITKPEEAVYEYGIIDIIDLDLVSEDLPWGQVSPEAGNAAFRYLEKAISYANEGAIQGICTAPLNKEALHKAGHVYPGHTEILAELTNTKDFAMMLSAPGLRVIHATTHVGLMDAIKKNNAERQYTVIRLAHETLQKAGIESPRIAVCGINPHAGENGLFGNGEEEEKIIPAIEKAQAEGINVQGPLPADTLFFRAKRGDFDIVVAQYHDQGHGPIKVLGLEAGVNITVGLPTIRTSVDHGTAFDIAGKNIADELSLKEALRMAVELAPENES
ncbi:4-hydroxythreonine-4-phosphate dehydrogenase [Oceanobacillus oncorhynchi subsp. incaldanensis]|uniref:4-hydroxythreonine-4-phosphate dehydrogenase 2 n=2 Tax=Oceanobacillus TaxID=182709 RepID=A0A0A1MGK1_9BACI|nr:4-hydroxythreonine-4-phosphate dehydrogenase PdxA [Oceanobacillus oncorhynchi]GIO20832.1 4-hydroxythreonine-4-phosphate dehydrogenase [Oceanobacillus oncorhynchi subsp. incaldanensis]CEI84550.1 4-hydroxythreonine-4-phosphate dehydrogenase 2 [Oceanobacillus oncorhynchi]